MKIGVTSGFLLFIGVCCIALSLWMLQVSHNHLNKLEEEKPKIVQTIDLSTDFKGRVVPSFDIPNIRIEIPFSQVRSWEENALMTYCQRSELNWETRERDEWIELMACRPDSVTTGAFQFSIQKIESPWQKDKRYVTKPTLLGNTLTLSPEISPNVEWKYGQTRFLGYLALVVGGILILGGTLYLPPRTYP